MPSLGIEVLPHGEGLQLPAYETRGSAGMDLRAAIAGEAPLTLEAGARLLVPTGLKMQIPDGFEAQIRPRSGLAYKHGLTCLNTPGTIDSDYRGEIKVLLINLGAEPFVIERGLRIAQMVIAPVVQLPLEVRLRLDDTARGEGGFGSTGSA
ncbi:dUTP diphosphatase [Pseudohoeflea sp. DP4N28-3]|uniref:Deoxyuridine 5'-triphosphate nucleotidohydrolase n=2 Tax=Pseudohoeflea coraliihabitans TaxID=2860393 RepID=A0ABS6WNU8_9HYPH|nr:dUTP diphosphatase [Pseudohoeflea sp. DP4N28-3]MBW3097618.1 dUTP diphosphatase [Pseudohoeflea sp. DP4N28-3]